MNITTRLEKLEKKTGVSEFRRAHIIIVKSGGSKKEAIEEFKRTHNVHPDDDFTIFQLVAPDPNKFRRD